MMIELLYGRVALQENRKLLAKATAKTKAKAKSKAPAAMKSGIFELTKCRSSDLKEALPRFNRADTKKNMEKEVLAKVGL